MGVQRYARRDESIKGAEFALKQEKKKSWLKYVLVFGLIFFACWYERNFLAQAAEKIRKLPNWTIFIIIVLITLFFTLIRVDILKCQNGRKILGILSKEQQKKFHIMLWMSLWDYQML